MQSKFGPYKELYDSRKGQNLEEIEATETSHGMMKDKVLAMAGMIRAFWQYHLSGKYTVKTDFHLLTNGEIMIAFQDYPLSSNDLPCTREIGKRI